MTESSIFEKYYLKEPFKDRFEWDRENAIDVIIPLMHTNELWMTNLLSIYREIPVNRLILGDGGCIDDSIEIAKTFPRVIVQNHRDFKSLGFSIKKLIESVETEWFVYLHTDVYIPSGWFEDMKKHREDYDWFECRQQITVLAEYPLRYNDDTRPYSGSQMGRKKAFEEVIPIIEDDYLYRNEDIVIADLMKRAGHKYGRADDCFHFHQVMNKRSQWERKIGSVRIDIQPSKEEEIRALEMQVKGLIKYMKPNPQISGIVKQNYDEYKRIVNMDDKVFFEWVRNTNPEWMPYIKKWSQKNVFKIIMNRMKMIVSIVKKELLP